MLTLRRDHLSVSLADDGLEVGLGSWLVSPAERAAERSVTRGVTDPPRSLCRTETRCARSMRPVRGISNRAPLKPQSKDRSLCVRRRVISQAGKLSRAYLRNAGTPYLRNAWQST